MSRTKPASRHRAPASPTTAAKAADRARQIQELRELIAALDRRVPRIERAGEAAIARDAAALREKALHRLAALER